MLGSQKRSRRLGRFEPRPLFPSAPGLLRGRFRIGPFSNRYMLMAVGISVLLLLLVCSVPPLQLVFNTHFMSLREWGVVLGLSVIPAISEEITKFFLRRKMA